MEARCVTLHIANGSLGHAADALRLGKVMTLAATDIIFLREGLNFIFVIFAQQHQTDQKLDAKNREGYTLLLAMRS